MRRAIEKSARVWSMCKLKREWAAVTAPAIATLRRPAKHGPSRCRDEMKDLVKTDSLQSQCSFPERLCNCRLGFCRCHSKSCAPSALNTRTRRIPLQASRTKRGDRSTTCSTTERHCLGKNA